MEALERKLNQNLDPNTERFIMEKYMYLPQIAGTFAYFRGYWLPLSLLWILLGVLLTGSVGLMVFFAALEILKVSFSLASFLIHVLFGCLLIVIIVVVFTLKRPIFIKIFRQMSNRYQYDKSYDTSKAKVWIEEGKKMGGKLNIAIAVHFLVMALSIVFFTPILDNLQGITKGDAYLGNVFMDVPAPLYFPVKLEETFAFYFLYTINIMAAVVLLSQLLSAILFAFTFFEHTNIELKILIDSIENVEKRAFKSCVEKYEGYEMKTDPKEIYKDEKFLNEYKLRIRENFVHHQQLIEFQSIVDDVLSWPLFFTAINISVGMACGMLSVMKGDTRLAPQLNSFLLLVMEIASITVICKRGTVLTTLAQSLHMSFYKTRWMYLPKDIKSSIIIFQERTKNYMTYKAGGMTAVNWEFHTTIMNTAYTYFNLVFATKESK